MSTSLGASEFFDRRQMRALVFGLPGLNVEPVVEKRFDQDGPGAVSWLSRQRVHSAHFDLTRQFGEDWDFPLLDEFRVLTSH